MTKDPARTIADLTRFTGNNLTRTLTRIEAEVHGMTSDRAPEFLDGVGAERSFLAAAGEIKRLAGQINVTIHAIGILLCLPHILEPDEHVEYASLGAGNTGRQFDLETNFRVAEFKFINWRGGSESIRQNSIFKDYFQLAEAPTNKRKYLYLLGTQQALAFFNGGRAISSVLSRGDKVQKLFYERFSDRYTKTRDYFRAHQHEVNIVDVSEWLHELRTIAALDVVDEPRV